MRWEEVQAANDERVKRKRTLEGPEKDNCWWRKDKEKKKKSIGIDKGEIHSF